MLGFPALVKLTKNFEFSSVSCLHHKSSLWWTKFSFSSKWWSLERLLLANRWWNGRRRCTSCLGIRSIWMVWIWNRNKSYALNRKGLSNAITYALQSPMKTTARMNKMFMMKYKTRLSWFGVCWFVTFISFCSRLTMPTSFFFFVM